MKIGDEMKVKGLRRRVRVASKLEARVQSVTRASGSGRSLPRSCRVIPNRGFRPRTPTPTSSHSLKRRAMNSQDALRKLAQQLQRASSGGGGGIPGGKGFFAGGGLLVALIGGGLALNASLFNGTYKGYHHIRV